MKTFLGGFVFKIICILMAVLEALGVSLPFLKDQPDPEWTTDYKYVFVHGAVGWGEYNIVLDNLLPYFGIVSYDICNYLKMSGFDCCKASVSIDKGMWDRACEVYAQLSGTRVDYGKAHSEKCGHERYGKDYSNDPLMTGWSSENKVNLIGHSFGGETVRMLTELMVNGSEEERKATTDGSLSPLFEGGKGDWIYSVIALSTPMNGSTMTESVPVIKKLYNELYNFDAKKVYSVDSEILQSRAVNEILLGLTELITDIQLAGYDSSMYEMTPDGAMKFNEMIGMDSGIYYISQPACATVTGSDGVYQIPAKGIDPALEYTAYIMGRNEYSTPNGYVIDSSWFPNDGLVNTISEIAPFDDSYIELTGFNTQELQKGVWNVLPIHNSDHISLVGGLLRAWDIKDYYAELCGMINRIEN